MEFAGFVYPAFDQVIGHVGRIRWRYRGHLTVTDRRSPARWVRTLVQLRVPHRFPRVATSSTRRASSSSTPRRPYDAKGLMEAALASPDPVDVPGTDPALPRPEGRGPGRAVRDSRSVEPSIRRPGTDVTVVTLRSTTCMRLMKAAEALDAEGIAAEVIDLRSDVPMGHRHGAWPVSRRPGGWSWPTRTHLTGGFGAEIAATVTEKRCVLPRSTHAGSCRRTWMSSGDRLSSSRTR